MFGNEPTLFRLRGLFGIPVEVRQSLVLLALLFVVFSARSVQGLVDALITVALIAGSIYLHELGHAWGCRVQGIAVERIVIFGGGGFCQHRRSTLRQDELIVAMGPIVNLALWAIASLWVNIQVEGLTSMAELSAAKAELLYWAHLFALINLVLFVFNLVPVQPLDGGRLLVIGLARMMPPERALRVAGTVGVVFCVLWWPGMFALYFFFGWLLLFAPSLRQHLAMMRGEVRG